MRRIKTGSRKIDQDGETEKPSSPDSRRNLIHKILPTLLGAGTILPLGLAINYFLNIALARYLPVEQFGMFGVIHSLVTVLSLAAALGFSNSMMRFVSVYKNNQEYALLTGIFKGSLGLIAAMLVVMSAGLLAVNALFYNNGSVIFWAVLLLIPFTIDLWRQSSLRGLKYTIEAILPKDLLLPLCTLIAVSIWQIRSVTVVLAIYVSVISLFQIIGVWRLKSILAKITNHKPELKIKHWLSVSAPMGLSTLARQGIVRWDIIVVGAVVGLEATGQYTAASRTALLAVLVLRIINLAVGPYLAEAYHSGNILRFRSIIRLSTLASILFGLPFYLLVMIFPEFIMRIFGDEYAAGSQLLQILITGQLINLVTGPVGLALNMANHHRVNMMLILIAAVISIIGLVLFVPLYGAIGAAWVTSVTGALLNISLLLYLYGVVLRNEYGLSAKKQMKN